jgi:hypothetical protein
MQSTNHTLQRLSDLAQCAVASQEPTDMMALSSAITDQLFDAKSLASDQHEHTVLAHVVTLCDTHQVRLIASTHTRSVKYIDALQRIRSTHTSCGLGAARGLVLGDWWIDVAALRVTVESRHWGAQQSGSQGVVFDSHTM